ncbi:MAG: hypothetical protein ACRDRS_23240 [Pseudonocardiaceae bacterium]
MRRRETTPWYGQNRDVGSKVCSPGHRRRCRNCPAGDRRCGYTTPRRGGSCGQDPLGLGEGAQALADLAELDALARRCGGRVLDPGADGLGAAVVGDYLRHRP